MLLEIAAAAGLVIKAIDWWNRPKGSQLAELDLRYRWLRDEDGIRIEMAFSQPTPEYSVVIVAVLSPRGDPLMPQREDDANDDGNYFQLRNIVDGTCVCYVPFGAVQYASPGKYTVRLARGR